MTREQQYGMIFRKVKEDSKYFKGIDYRPDMDQTSPYYHNRGGVLQSLDDLDKGETSLLISALSAIISGAWVENPGPNQGGEKYFTHDSFYIDYNYGDPPTVTLFETFTMPMVDFKELLEEWLAFLKS